ncbi:MAG: TonB-dependent receptor plug domain-containing protein [Calditrichaceae bacterium]
MSIFNHLRIYAIVLFLIVLVSHTLGSDDSTKVKQDRMAERVILTAEDFKKLNCENVGDALSNLSGVTVSSLGEVSLRDVSSSKVVIIFDGQKLNTAGGTGVRVNSISIENIEKVELLRGGRSAQYGADAVGGVIRITSKTQKSQEALWNVGARASYGSYNNQIYGLNHSLSSGSFDYFASYKRETWDGDFEYTDNFGERVNLENNEQDSYFLFLKSGYRLDDIQNINASFSYYKADNGTPGMIDNQTPNARIRFDNKSYNLNYDNKALFKDFSMKMQGYFLDNETKFDDPDGLVPVHSDHDNYALGIDLQQAGNLSELLSVSYGYSYRNDRIESTDIENKNRDTQSGFSTLTIAKDVNKLISRWDVALALRYDAPSDFDPEFSPRLSIGVSSNNDLVNTSLQTHITRSYRAPTFNDLYWPRDAFAVGNPDLKPEVGFNYDIGINLSKTIESANLSGSVNYFVNEVTDLILWAQDPALNNLWTPKNISETSTKGIEFSSTIDLFKGKVVLNSEYTYMKALDKGPDPNRNNKYIIYKPKNKLDFTGTFRLYDFEWNIMYHYYGLRYTNPANTLWLDAVSLIDTNVTYKFDFNRYKANITFEVSNLTDEDYQRVRNTAEPGRMFKMSFGIDI